MKYDKRFFTCYTILWVLLGVFLICTAPGCARPHLLKIPRPSYPVMEDVKIDTNGCVCDTMLTRAINNMLKLQEWGDSLSISPCWEDK